MGVFLCCSNQTITKFSAARRENKNFHHLIIGQGTGLVSTATVASAASQLGKQMGQIKLAIAVAVVICTDRRHNFYLLTEGAIFFTMTDPCFLKEFLSHLLCFDPFLNTSLAFTQLSRYSLHVSFVFLAPCKKGKLLQILMHE